MRHLSVKKEDGFPPLNRANSLVFGSASSGYLQCFSKLLFTSLSLLTLNYKSKPSIQVSF